MAVIFKPSFFVHTVKSPEWCGNNIMPTVSGLRQRPHTHHQLVPIHQNIEAEFHAQVRHMAYTQ
jgi:hypothetical protein